MNLAVIGTSKIAQKLTSTFLTFPDMQVNAVYSRTKEKGKEFASVFSCTKVYTDLEDMVNDKEIDLVYIASPNALHVAQSKICLQHGKHVFCEKPIAFSRDELDSLIALAKQNHCFFQEAMTVTYMPNISILKQAIQDKHPHLLTCDLSQYSIQYDALKQGEISNVFAKQMKGGALYDLGVYCLHFVYGILGYPKAMTKYDVRYTNGIDTSGVIVMQYEQCNAIISYGKDSKGSAHTRIQCEEGYYDMEGACSRLRTIVFHDEQGTHALGTETKENHHWYEVDAFLKMIQKNNHAFQQQQWEQSLAVCQLLEELQEKGDKTV